MPLDIDFGLPFPRRVSPDAQAVEKPHSEWLLSCGMFEDPREREFYESFRFPVAAAYLAPRARGEDLRLVLDGVGWNGLLDNWIADNGPRNLEKVDRACAEVLAVMEGTGGRQSSTEPMVRVFEDLWPRLCEGMSPAWQRRMTQRMREWFRDMRYELVDRGEQIKPTVAEYWRMRHSTLDLEYFVGLAERGEHHETPDVFWRTSHREAIQREGNIIVSIMNDVESAEKEEQAGEPHNIVLITEREQACSRREAIDTVLVEVRAATRRLLRLQDELPSLCSRLRFGPQEQRDILAYPETLKNICMSTWIWGNQSGRYIPRQTQRSQT